MPGSPIDSGLTLAATGRSPFSVYSLNQESLKTEVGPVYGFSYVNNHIRSVLLASQCEVKTRPFSPLVSRLSLTLIFPSKVSIQAQGLIHVSPLSAITGCSWSSCFLLPTGPEIRASSLGVTFSLPALRGAISTVATRWQHFCTDHINFQSTSGGFCHQHQDVPCLESRYKNKTLGYINSQQKILRRLVPPHIYSTPVTHPLPNASSGASSMAALPSQGWDKPLLPKCWSS